ncbi:CaiB/BaiF CoA transferase family protein [Ramlibacter sp.]|uniref:CaiB/BaiF CoA transferase family protein n=1 Tax=Ramlibacter sp. TaxID=1917967 RepID=UPI003D10802E
MLDKALEGIRVIDFSQIGSGPTCTVMLADLGADVIKVEAASGDIARPLGPPYVDGDGMLFLALNRNKRGVSVNLKDPADRDRMLKLCEDADVVAENFRPGVMERLGFGYEALSKRNPRLVYCSISGYGQKGAWRERGGMDGVVQALSGLMAITGEDGGVPIKVQVPIVDIVTGFLAANAVQAALHDRNRTGKGQHIDTSMMACALMLQQTAFAGYVTNGEVPVRSGSAAPYAAPNEAFPTGDGWIMIIAYQDERWRALVELLDAPQLAEDPRFATMDQRIANRPAMVEAVAQRLRRNTTAHWLEVLGAGDVLCAPIATYAETAKMPPVADSGMIIDVPHPTRGTIRQVGCALTLPAAPARRGAPGIGEHNDEVFGSLRR